MSAEDEVPVEGYNRASPVILWIPPATAVIQLPTSNYPDFIRVLVSREITSPVPGRIFNDEVEAGRAAISDSFRLPDQPGPIDVSTKERQIWLDVKHRPELPAKQAALVSSRQDFDVVPLDLGEKGQAWVGVKVETGSSGPTPKAAAFPSRALATSEREHAVVVGNTAGLYPAFAYHWDARQVIVFQVEVADPVEEDTPPDIPVIEVGADADQRPKITIEFDEDGGFSVRLSGLAPTEDENFRPEIVSGFTESFQKGRQFIGRIRTSGRATRRGSAQHVPIIPAARPTDPRRGA